MRRQGREQEHDQQEHHRMDDSRHGSPSTAIDIGHRTSDSPRYWDSPEERHHHISYALTDQFAVRVVLRPNHTIRHRGREEALHSAQ